MNSATSVASVALRRMPNFSLNRLGDVGLASLWTFIAVGNIVGSLSRADHESLMRVAHELASASVQ